MKRKKPKAWWQKAWYFLWEDDSALSWVVNILLAFIIIKYAVYPFLGFALGTTHPIVAVVSGSMEHDGTFDQWWEKHEDLYEREGITKQEFQEFRFSNGFNTGDIMVLYGKPLDEVEQGDVLVYQGRKRDPIIHRVVNIQDDDGLSFKTKGDHNKGSNIDEVEIEPYRIIGYQKYDKASVAVLRVPYLGYLKMGFVWIISEGVPSLVQVFR